MMTARLFEPLAPRIALTYALVVLLGMTGYCLAYNWLQGRQETLTNALAWPSVNLLPFLAAFETGKRLPQWPSRLAAIFAATIFSVALSAIAGSPDLAFEAIRRLPTILGVLGALTFADWLATSTFSKPPVAAGPLPLRPSEIDYVRAAGNYVELHGLGRTILHRATLSTVAETLQPHGFLRIHRSTLVRQDAVARWRSGHVEMRDGQLHPIGTRYRVDLPTSKR